MGLYLFLRNQYQKSPKKMLRWVGVIVGGGLILLVITGRAHWIVAVIGGILPFLGVVAKAMFAFFQFGPLLARLQRTFGVFGSGPLHFQTAWLDVSVDRRTGAIDGVVKQGEFQGQQLSKLDSEQLNRLLQACHADHQSVALLRAYLYRTRSDWRTGETSQDDARDSFEESAMSADTAARILGVSPRAGEAEIRTAHRKLAQKLHPDRGGNDYLARKINQARDTLLKK